MRIEGKKALEPLQHVDEERAEYAESQQRGRVLGPTLFRVFLDARELVEKDFKRPKHRMQEGSLTLKQGRHKRADGLCQRQQHDEVNGDLEKTIGCHIDKPR